MKGLQTSKKNNPETNQILEKQRRYLVITDDSIAYWHKLEMYYPERTESSTAFQAHTLFHCTTARPASGRLSYILNARQ